MKKPLLLRKRVLINLYCCTVILKTSHFEIFQLPKQVTLQVTHTISPVLSVWPARSRSRKQARKQIHLPPQFISRGKCCFWTSTTTILFYYTITLFYLRKLPIFND